MFPAKVIAPILQGFTSGEALLTMIRTGRYRSYFTRLHSRLYQLAQLDMVYLVLGMVKDMVQATSSGGASSPNMPHQADHQLHREL
jgi:hypothetical protein